MYKSNYKKPKSLTSTASNMIPYIAIAIVIIALLLIL